MEPQVESIPKLLTYEEAKIFIRELERKTNKALRELKANERISYSLRNANPELGRFTYNEIKKKEIHGCVVIGFNLRGKPDIVHSYHVPRAKLHADLNIGKKLEVKQNEKRWSTR